MMEEVTDEEARRRYGQELHIASLAVIDEGAKIRVVHDASHGVQVNHRIKVLDQVRYPGAGEVRQLLYERRQEGKRGFAILGDASKAHRRIQVLPRDWGLQACRLMDNEVWLNKAGTYGVGSAGYYWSRLAGALHRLGFYAVGGRWSFEALLFADDWASIGCTRSELEDIGVVIFLLSLVGFPWNWKKFRGGTEVGWIGYTIDFDKYTLGISEKRAQWLVSWVSKTLEEGHVLVSDLEAVVGRFGFAMIPLDYLRPFLAPIYAWLAAVRNAGRLKLPWSVSFLLKFLSDELAGGGRVCEVRLHSVSLGEAFRADAKAEGSLVRVGGWECRGGTQPGQARWFAVELTRKSAPWAFSRGEPFRTIAALELFATLLCVVLFSPGWPSSSSGSILISGTTDNLGNSWTLARLMSTKFPLVLILGELATQLRRNTLALELNWAPRGQNEEADALTNADFPPLTQLGESRWTWETWGFWS